MTHAYQSAARKPEITGVFRARQVLPEDANIQAFADQLRALADPQVAAIVLHAAPYAGPRSVVVAPQRADVSHTLALCEWLGNTATTQAVTVPTSLRRVVCCFKAWTTPIATGGDCYGVIALPMLERSEALQRQVLSLVCDFALRLESAERRRILERLRIEEVTDGQTHLTSMPANGLKYA